MNVEDDFTIYTAHRRNILCDSYSKTHRFTVYWDSCKSHENTSSPRIILYAVCKYINLNLMRFYVVEKYQVFLDQLGLQVAIWIILLDEYPSISKKFKHFE